MTKLILGCKTWKMGRLVMHVMQHHISLQLESGLHYILQPIFSILFIFQLDEHIFLFHFTSRRYLSTTQQKLLRRSATILYRPDSFLHLWFANTNLCPDPTHVQQNLLRASATLSLHKHGTFHSCGFPQHIMLHACNTKCVVLYWEISYCLQTTTIQHCHKTESLFILLTNASTAFTRSKNKFQNFKWFWNLREADFSIVVFVTNATTLAILHATALAILHSIILYSQKSGLFPFYNFRKSPVSILDHFMLYIIIAPFSF